MWTNAKYAVHKPYDWTFSTLYQGQIDGPSRKYLGGKIDYGKLNASRDINHYDEVIMYEDELADQRNIHIFCKAQGDGLWMVRPG